MKAFRYILAAAVTAAPLLLAAPAAQALTSHQYATQGHGRYTYSSGRPMRYSHRGWHRHRNHWRRHWHHRHWR